MVDKEIFIQYREEGELASAYSVTLDSRDNTYGIKRYDTGEVLVASGQSGLVTNPSTGVYSYSGSFEEGIVYVVSWKVVPNNGDAARYLVQQIGPFQSSSRIRAVSDFRGVFRQSSRGTLFLVVTDLDGNSRDPEDISYTILDTDNDVVIAGIPAKAAKGYYVFDWDIPFDQAAGKYVIQWSYTVDGEDKIEIQDIVIAATGDAAGASVLYDSRVVEFRMALTNKITYAQKIPVYREPAKQSRDRKTYEFSWPRWNQSSGLHIYVNDNIQTQGFEIDYFSGKVTFENPLTKYDRVEATYNFRWFSDEELDRCLSDACHLLNIWPPATRMSVVSLDLLWIPVVLYGAAVDALRSMMLSLQFQEPQLVFGGPEAAGKVYSNLEGLKKNYEETWNKALEQKKNGPYVGLTKMISTPEFALPGGRSRWFRYMFSSGS